MPQKSSVLHLYDANTSSILREYRHVWTWKGRQSPCQGQEPLRPCRAPVPRGSSPPSSPLWQLRRASGSRRSSLPGSRDGVPSRRDPRVGRQRRPRQQEAEDQPPPPPARHPQRRRVEQALERCHHRPGRRPAQHPGSSPTEEDQHGRQEELPERGVLDLPLFSLFFFFTTGFSQSHHTSNRSSLCYHLSMFCLSIFLSAIAKKLLQTSDWDQYLIVV